MAHRVVLGLAAIGLLGCAARGPVDNPIVRNLSWFSYLAGEDLRQDCRAGAPERFRFVYNAEWGEQVRTYDLDAAAPGLPATLQTRVFGGASLTVLSLDDLLAPWRGASDLARLGPGDLRRLSAALAASGFERPAPVGAFLRSDDFYWVVNACVAGRFRFNAWPREHPRFASLAFPAVLLRYDGTGVPVRRPPDRLALGPYQSGGGRTASGGDPTQRFRLQIGRDGLRVGPLDR